jgi:predicted XRE-type DNA-binding protein
MDQDGTEKPPGNLLWFVPKKQPEKEEQLEFRNLSTLMKRAKQRLMLKGLEFSEIVANLEIAQAKARNIETYEWKTRREDNGLSVADQFQFMTCEAGDIGRLLGEVLKQFEPVEDNCY